jgi:predicted esterase
MLASVNPKFLPVLLSLSACSMSAPVAARTIELGFPNLEQRVQVSFPEDHRPGATFPGLFYYHGTNGTADTTLMRRHAGPQGWFVVGMTYVQKGKFTFTPETLDDELLVLRSVIRHLAAGHGLDPKRVYVAGFSKGGWISGLLLQREPALAGAVIMGAGHVHEVGEPPSKLMRRTPVFIGVGRKDGNYPFSLRAVSFFRGRGATTTMETWHGSGHRFPESGSPALRQWLAVRSRPADLLKKEAATWAKKQLGDIAAIRDPVNRWVAHRDAEQTPYFKLLDETARRKFIADREALEETAAVRPEASLLDEHRRLLRSEISSRSGENYQKLLREYLALSQTGRGTRQGEIALLDHDRIERLLKHFDEQEKIRDTDAEPFGPEPDEGLFVPKPPDNRPVIPRNPLVK